MSKTPIAALLSVALPWLAPASPAVPLILVPAEGAQVHLATPILSGTAPANAAVRLALDGSTVANVQADAAGNWTALPQSSIGISDHEVVAWAADGTGTSAPSETRHFTVSSGAPDAPRVLVPASGTRLESEGVLFAGTGEAGTIARIWLDGSLQGAADVFPNGLWTFPSGVLERGAHTLLMDAAAPGGSAGPRSDAVPFTVVATSYYEFGCSASPGRGSGLLWALPLLALVLRRKRRGVRAILGAAAMVVALGGCGGGPTVTITSPEDRKATNSASVAVLGTASSDIRLVLVNGVPASSVDGFQTWAAAVPLAMGGNIIAVTAYPADGRVIQTRIVVTRYPGLEAVAPPMAFDAIRGQSQLASPGSGFPVSISGPLTRWRISGPPWIRFSQATGEGPAVVTVTADPAGQPLGTLQSQVTVADDESGDSHTLPVSLQVRAAALVIDGVSYAGVNRSRTGLAFAVDAGSTQATLAQALTISDELGGALPSESVSWQVESISAPWVLLSASSYRTSPRPQVVVTIDLQALSGLSPGRYGAEIKLRWTNAERTDQVVTLPVDLDLSVNPTFGAIAPELSFAAIQGGTLPAQPAAGYPISISGAFSRWRVSGPSWVRVSAAAGSGPATVTVTADATDLGYGTFAAPITVTDDTSGQSRTFAAMLENRAANPVLTPSSLSFLVDSLSPAAGLTKTLNISDELDGTVPADSVSWAVQSISVPWLEVTPVSGSTAPASQVAVNLRLSALSGVPAGQYPGTIVLRWSNAQRADQTVSIAVSLDLRVNLVFGVTAPAMSFSAIRGSAPPAQPTAGYAVSIQGGLARWHVTGPSWARFSAASGIGPATVTVTADGTGLPYGVSTSQVVVSDDDSGLSRSFTITFDNRAAALTVSPIYLGFVVDGIPPTSGLTRTLDISDELGGAVPAESVSWVVDLITVPWLEVTPSGGGTSPIPQVSLNLRLNALSGFQVGQYTGDIMLRWSNAQRQGYVYLHVLLDLRVNLAFGATAPAMPFSAIRGSPPPAQPTAGYGLSIQGGLAQWRVTGPSWARFSATSGTGPATVTVTADGTGLPYGVSTSQVVVSDAVSGQSRSFPITFDNRAAALTVFPTSLSFLVDGLVPSTGTSRTLNISDELGSAVSAESVSWAVQSISVPWLNVTPASGGSSPAPQASVNLNMDPLAGVPVGQYTGTIVLGWSNAQRTNQTVAITVSLDLRVNVVFGVVAPPMAFTAFHGSPPPAQPAAGYTVTIVGGLAQWRVAGPSWARFSAASGTGGATVTVTADPTGLDYGTFSSQVVVTDDVTGQSRSFPISLDHKAAGLVVSPTTLAFTVGNTTPASALSANLSVTDELGGAVLAESVPWSVQSISAPWLGVTPPSGGTAPAQQLTVALDPDRLVSMPSGHFTATIMLAWSNAQRTGQTTAISVGLDLNLTLPNVEFASPYVGVAGRPGALILRGQRFLAGGSTVTAYVGDTDVPGVVPDSDTQARLTYPALPAGRYPVGIRGGGGITGPGVELVVLPAAGLGYAAIPAATNRTSLVWDAERQSLYGINRDDQVIERYRFSGRAWVTDPRVAIPELRDAQLLPHGRRLVVVAKHAISDVDLTATSWVPVTRFQPPAGSCSQYLSMLAMTNTGKAFVPLYSSCSSERPYLYNGLDYSAAPFTSYTLSSVAGCADGSRAYVELGSNNVRGIDALNYTFTGNSGSFDLFFGAPASRDASRIIFGRTRVHDRSLTFLGNVGSSSQGTIVSGDASRAFVYRDDNMQPRLLVYDLNGPLQPGSTYPVLRTIALPERPSSAAGRSVLMTISHDDSVVFVSGDLKILVVPVGDQDPFSFPFVDFASPYVGVANQAGSLIVRGRNFTNLGGTVTAYVGGIDFPGISPDGETQFRLSYPPLPEGRYPVGVRNPGGAPATTAELVVMPAPPFSYQFLPASSVRQRLVWDAERRALYGINEGDQQLERYRFSGDTWVVDPPLVLGGLRDAALSPNGRLLLLVSSQGIYDLRPDDSPWVPTLRVVAPQINCNGYLRRLGIANNGMAWVLSVMGPGCSGGTPSFFYNAVDHSMVQNQDWFYDGQVIASADGSRAYAGGYSWYVTMFDPLTNTMSNAGSAYHDFYGVSVSGNASRVILNSREVYNRALVPTGNLGLEMRAALASRDSGRAFVYRDDGVQPRLDVYDLNATPDSMGLYPVTRTVPLPDSAMVAGSYGPVTMAATHDDSVVFVSGDRGILVVPVAP